jgi:nitrogen PTS system EIIA component
MNLTKVIKPECCENDFSAKNKTEALQNIATLLKRSDETKNISLEKIIEALTKREEMGSTGFGKGIAIPHCQIEDMKQFIICIAVSKKGIDFDSLDKKKVKIFVTIIGPGTDRSDYLKLLATVSQVLKEPGAVDSLLHSKTKISLYEEFIRNSIAGNDIKHKKGQDKLMLLFVNDEDIMQDIAEVFLEYGIQDSTIIETQKMDNLLSKVPLFMGFFNFTGERNPYRKIIMLKINSQYLNALIKSLEDDFGDLDNYSGLNVMVLDLFFSKGF